jgi:hypothetical protein
MKLVAFALFALTVAAVSLAQTPSTKKPAFDIASIKQNTAPEGNRSLGDQPGGRFVAPRIYVGRRQERV